MGLRIKLMKKIIHTPFTATLKGLVILGIFFTFSTSSAFSCQIFSYEKIFVLKSTPSNGQSKPWKDAHNCTPDQLNKAEVMILNSEGVLRSEYFDRSQKNSNIDLKPSRIHVTQINKFIKRSLNLPAQQRVLDIHPLGERHFLPAKIHQNISVHCQECDSLGKKNILLKLHSPLNKREESIWIRAKVAILTRALFIRKQMRVNFKALAKDQFSEKLIYSTKPEQLFTNWKVLPFYRNNKTLKTNGPLLHSQVSPLSLVKSGVIANVVIEAKGFTLSNKGMPLRSGTIGEYINIRSLKSKKVITAEVIGINKVKVSL